jgi:TolB protein
MDRDGSNVVRLTDHPAEDRSPAVSPDGSQIAFMSNRAGLRNVFIMNSDGSDVRQLTSQGTNMDPSWSPDGKQIVFVSNREGPWLVYTMNPDGGEVTSLKAIALNWQSRPVFSPDGQRIAFASARDDPFYGDIFVMNADGSAPENLTPGAMAGRYPVWSPDGSTLAFWGSADPRQGAPWRVYLMDLETRAVTQLTSFSAEPHAWAWFPAAR